MLYGRESATDRIGDLLRSARCGRGSALAVLGPAGIGKTAVLELAAEESAEHSLVLHTRGTAGEQAIPYAGLAAILAPLFHLLPSLSPTQAQSLAGALGLDAPVPDGALPVYMATLRLLSTAAQERPVLLVVDDCHWMDSATMQAIHFLRKRIDHDAVSVILSARAEEHFTPLPPDIPVLELIGLDAPAAAALLNEHGLRLDDDAMAGLVAATGGNPLALRDLPIYLTAAEIAGFAQGSRPVPISPVLEAAYGGASLRLDENARLAALIVAVLDGVDIRVAEQALGAVGLPLTALEAGQDAELVKLGRGRVQIRHPLVRSAVIQMASASERRRAHSAAATGLSTSRRPADAESRVWHLAEATLGVDEAVAELLEGLGRAAIARSGYAAASMILQRAAEISPGGEARVRRILGAAEAAFMSGHEQACRRLLREVVSERVDDPRTREAVEHLNGRLETWSGDPSSAARRMQSQAERLRRTDPLFSIQLSVDAAAAAALAGQMKRASEAAELVMTITADFGPETELIGDLLMGSVQAMRGDGTSAFERLDRCRPALDIDELPPEHLQSLVYLATSYLFIDRFEDASGLFNRAIALARRRGAVGQLPFALAHRANTEYRLGSWDDSYADAFESLTLSEFSGRAADGPIAMIMLAQVEATRGVEEARSRARSAIQKAIAHGTQFIEAQGYSMIGLLDLGLGRPAAAVEALRRCQKLAVRLGLLELGYLQWAAELIEALTQIGRTQEAFKVLDFMRAATHDTSTPLNRAVLERCIGILESAAWQDHFHNSLDLHAASQRPFELARTQLCFGEKLRRNRQRKGARVQLAAAWETFARLGATPWMERATRELEAAGTISREAPWQVASLRVTGPELRLLTPQEYQVALAVARGATNREAADALFLSQKTVEFHLTSVYRRLSLKSRRELMDMVNNSARGAS